jgi:cation diffusion facilitator CzcD-associated flavoprotein CzcO
MPNKAERQIVIIGSGFSGICLGIKLKLAGIDSFTILEKADRLGGTWRENTYPGAACDVPSISYCFSFEQKTDWSRLWSPHDEILAYMEHCSDKYGVTPHIRFGTSLESARFDADSGTWEIHTRQGDEMTADILVSGVGQLNRPSIPEIPGLDSFAGESFHSAQWNHDYDLTGKESRCHRQRGERNPVHPRDREAGRKALDLPAQRQLDGSQGRPRVHRG